MVCAPTIPTGFEKELRRFNPRLRVRFDLERLVWVVEERGRTDGNWYYVFLWADKDQNGRLQFRPLPETPGPIIEYLKQIDVARFERAGAGAWKAFAGELEGSRKRYMESWMSKQKQEFADGVKEKFAYHIKGRRSVDFGRGKES